MRRLVLITTFLAVFACQKGTPPTTPPAAAPVATADTPADASATPAAEEGDEEAKKKAEEQAAVDKQQKQIDAMLERANKRAEEAKAHWTPEVVAAFEKMRGKRSRLSHMRLKWVLASGHRAPGNADRDKYRHPAETLAFFGLRPGMKVFEVGPGAGWYTEILAPFLAQGGGTVSIAGPPEKQDTPMAQAAAKVSELWLTSPGPLYSNVEALPQPEGDKPNVGAEGSLDMVFVIRMFHNIERGKSWDTLMPALHTALKDGGVLAVVQHRAPEGADPVESAKKGYLPQKWLVEKIESYGFKLDESSEINANPKDTKDYEQGVWTLPPTLALGDKDKDKYLKIGESDRMTLRFKKVAK